MKKFLDALFYVFIGILTVICLFLLIGGVIVFALDFDRSTEKILVSTIVIVINFSLAFIFRKYRLYSIFIFVVSFALCFFLFYKAITDLSHLKQNRWMAYTTKWENKNHIIDVPFFVHPTGHIYLKAEINSEEKYLVFDTGADYTVINEKYNDTLSIDSILGTSSQARKSKMSIHRLDSLSFGDLRFNKLPYSALRKEAWEDCGIFKNQDSIAGILGNNVINNFVWDFDMVNRKVQIRDSSFVGRLGKVREIPLVYNGMGWVLDIWLNEEKKKIKLDSGSSYILNLTDSISIAKTYTYPIVNAGKSKGIFSYKDCLGNEIKVDSSKTTRQARKVFANLKIADTTYKDAYIIDKSKSNLLGIPLFWEYERVVLDFLSKKMYLINPVKNSNKYQISATSRRSLKVTKLQAIVDNGFYTINYIQPITIKTILRQTKDTLSFTFQDKVKVFASLDFGDENKALKGITFDSILGKGYLKNFKKSDSIYSEKLLWNRYKDSVINGEIFNKIF